MRKRTENDVSRESLVDFISVDVLQSMHFSRHVYMWLIAAYGKTDD